MNKLSKGGIYVDLYRKEPYEIGLLYDFLIENNECISKDKNVFVKECRWHPYLRYMWGEWILTAMPVDYEEISIPKLKEMVSNSNDMSISNRLDRIEKQIELILAKQSL